MIPVPQIDPEDEFTPKSPYKKVDEYPFLIDDSSPIPLISVETSYDIMFGKYRNFFDKVVIIDCRFIPEYDGGHIVSATNLMQKSSMIQIYNRYIGMKTCFIFHCEYSTIRGPKWAYTFRGYDRSNNPHPKLLHPHVFILSGGYKAFFQDYKSFTNNGCYIPMDDPSISRSLIHEYNRQFMVETGGFDGSATPPPSSTSKAMKRIIRFTNSQ